MWGGMGETGRRGRDGTLDEWEVPGKFPVEETLLKRLKEFVSTGIRGKDIGLETHVIKDFESRNNTGIRTQRSIGTRKRGSVLDGKQVSRK